MSDLNQYCFSGRLAAPPETKYTQGGMAIWSARVAIGYGYGDNKGTNWVTIKALGKRAEAFEKWTLSKGQQVWGCGELQVREYDRRDGGKGTAVEVLIEQFSSASTGGTATVHGHPSGGGAKIENSTDTPGISTDDFDDGMIPF